MTTHHDTHDDDADGHDAAGGRHLRIGGLVAGIAVLLALGVLQLWMATSGANIWYYVAEAVAILLMALFGHRIWGRFWDRGRKGDGDDR